MSLDDKDININSRNRSDMSLTLKSSDGELFDVDVNTLKVSELLKDFSISNDGEEPIPLDNVKADILKKVLMWAEHHANDQCESDSCKDDENRIERTDITDPWDLEFLKVDQETLFELVLAANYLNIKGLVDLTCRKIASMIKGKTPEELRDTFNLK